MTSFFSISYIAIELTMLSYLYSHVCTVAFYTYMHGQLYPNMQGLIHMHCLKETTAEEQNSSQSFLHMY